MGESTGRGTATGTDTTTGARVAAHAEAVPGLSVEGVSLSYGSTEILRGVTLAPSAPGTVTALVGPNGAGKSTLLRCMAGLARHSGEVRGPESLYLPQDPPPPSSLTVFESVLLARQQSIRGFAGMRVSREVRRDVAEVLDELGLAGLARHTMAQFSGGQRQLVSFAQAVVRRPEALLLDEPTSALDLRNQLTLLERIRDFAVSRPATVVITVHDLGHAARFADSVAVLSGGAVYAHGPAREVVTEEMLREVYRVDAAVTHTEGGGVAVAASRAL